MERSARLRWVGGEFRLRIEVPAELAAPEGDASAFLAIALPLAMYRDEDLHVDAEVSPLLLRRSEEIQAVYASWDPAARRRRVRAAAEAPVRDPGPEVTCSFSRGVDSILSAVSEREPPLTRLVYCDTLEPAQDERVRAEERRLTEELAALIGLPLAVVSTNLRDPAAQLPDYNDLFGAGLAFMNLSLAGGVGRAVVPPSMSYAALFPSGSHPLLDPLFSTESLTIEHDSSAEGRTGKVRLLATRHPELLPHLKVCYESGGAGNCGRCRKCVFTMICLQAAGALGLAASFPDEIDLALVRAARIDNYAIRSYWMHAAHALSDSPADRRLRSAIEHSVRRMAHPSPAERARAARDRLLGRRESADPAWSASASAHVRHYSNLAVATVRHGRGYRYGLDYSPAPPEPAWSVGPLPPDWQPPAQAPGLVGLVRLVDRREGRHVYAAGSVPAVAGAERAGELGSLLEEGDIPVWLSADGQLSTDSYDPRSSPAGPRKPLRWTLAPLRWGDLAPLPDRIRAAAERSLLATRTPNGSGPPDGGPVGFLSAQGGHGRLALWSSLHPITGDQLLSTSQEDARELGYGEPDRLGYLEPVASMSGRLGSARPFLPWARRFGL
ncbi:MAG TPA: hypothetical protein VGF21_07835 [Thermoleophilaceae bacterium]